MPRQTAASSRLRPRPCFQPCPTGAWLRWLSDLDDASRARRTPPAGRFRGFRRASRRPPGRVPRLRRVDPEAAAGLGPDAHVLRARVRQRPSRCVPPGGACDRGLRGRPPYRRRPTQRAVGEGDRVHAERDRGHQPRRVRVGSRQPRPRRRRRDHRARAPCELRAVAVHRAAHGRELPPHPDRRPGRAPARRPRRAGARGQRQGRGQQPRLEHARHHQPGRDACGVGARAGRDHGCRRGPGGSPPAGGRAGARAPTSSPSRPTSCAARAASGRSGEGASSSRR